MGLSGQTFHALLLSFLSWPDQRSPIWDVAEQTGLLSDVEKLQHHGVSNPDETYVPIMIPYELSDVTFTQVIDLRFYQEDARHDLDCRKQRLSGSHRRANLMFGSR